jgi:hypothetical protein
MIEGESCSTLAPDQGRGTLGCTAIPSAQEKSCNVYEMRNLIE